MPGEKRQGVAVKFLRRAVQQWRAKIKLGKRHSSMVN